MKYAYVLIGFIFLLISTSVFSQNFDATPRSMVTQPMDEGNRRAMLFPVQNGQSGASGNIVWVANFSSLTNWIAIGPAEMNPDNTFTITSGEGTWYFDAWTASTSGGNYALFTNGDPTNASHINNTFHLTFDSIFDLSALNNVIIEFEQYGARYYDQQLVEVSTDLGVTWKVVGTNDDIFRLTYDGGVPYPASMLRQYNITTAISDNPSQVMFRFTVDYNTDDVVNGKSYGWFIDDVKIREGFEYDLKLVQAFTSIGDNHISYTKLSEDRIFHPNTFINFGAIVKNEGSAPIEVSLKIISSNGIERVSPQSLLLQPHEIDTLTIEGTNGIDIYEFLVDEQYNFHFELETTEQLENTWNDTLNIPFEYFSTYNTNRFNTRDFYDGSDESLTGAFYEFDGEDNSGACLGMVFELFFANTLFFDGISVGISKLSQEEFQQIQGSSIYAEIYRYDGSSLEFLSSSEEYEIQFEDLGTHINLVPSNNSLNPSYLNTGDRAVVFICNSGSTFAPIQLSGLLPFKSVIGKNVTSWFYTAPDDYYQNMTFAPVIRLLTMTTISIDENELTTKKIQLYPNPGSEVINLSLTLTQQSTVSIDIVDVSGKLISKTEEIGLPEGEHQIPVSVASLSKGVYTLMIRTNNGVYMEKLLKN